MPMDEAGHSLSPDDCYAKGNCPECNAPLDGLDLAAHAQGHWSPGVSDAAEYREARRRREMILNFKPAPKLIAPAKE